MPGGQFVLVSNHSSDIDVVTFQPETLAGKDVDACRRVLEHSMTNKPLVILDMSRTSVIDGGMITMLLWAHRKLEQSGGQFMIAAPKPEVRELLNLSRLHRVVTIKDDLSSAITQAEERAAEISEGELIVGKVRRGGPTLMRVG